MAAESTRSLFRVIVLILCLCRVHAALDLPEGYPCVSHYEQANGTCVLARQCLSLILDKQSGDRPVICSFKGRESVICCSDCEEHRVEDIDKVVVDFRGRVLVKDGRKGWDKCLEYFDTIHAPSCRRGHGLRRSWNYEKNCTSLYNNIQFSVGGQDARRGDFPHMALLGYGEELETAQWLCGGSLISERFVLTAAHCGSSADLGEVRYVALGILSRSDPPEVWRRYLKKRFIPHPEYRSPIKYHDIALIETETVVTFERYVKPACLPYNVSERWGYATGWGALGPGREAADVMQKVYLDRFTNEECTELYPVHRHLQLGLNFTTQACYGYHGPPRDTCEGDSGGPLQTSDQNPYCVYTIIGVTSYGRTCGIEDGAGVYTRVLPYVSWIEDIVWPD